MSSSSDKLRSFIQASNQNSDRPVIKATLGYWRYFPRGKPSPPSGSAHPTTRRHSRHIGVLRFTESEPDPADADREDDDDDDDEDGTLSEMRWHHRRAMEAQMTSGSMPQRELSREHRPGSGRGSGHHGLDDRDGNYMATVGETLDNDRFLVKSIIGRGSFSTVVTAIDKATQEIVAIKIIRSKQAYFNQGCIEISVLQKVHSGENRTGHHLVNLKHYFRHGNHLCLVFELLSYNLYELLTISHFQGVTLNLVRKFGKQALEALDYLCSPGVKVVHGDIKPENILLVSSKHSAIKIADFGSASVVTADTVPYSYVQSRFYRAPEVLMGLAYSYPVDMWSLACVLVEMHTGVPLFRGANDADQLVRIAEYFGPPPASMIRASTQAQTLFARAPDGPTYTFLPSIEHQMTPKNLVDLLGAEIGGPNGSRLHDPGHSPADYAKFIDVIQRMLEYDPAKRITPHEALMHPFFHVSTTEEIHRSIRLGSPSLMPITPHNPFAASPRFPLPLSPFGQHPMSSSLTHSSAPSVRNPESETGLWPVPRQPRSDHLHHHHHHEYSPLSPRHQPRH